MYIDRYVSRYIIISAVELYMYLICILTLKYCEQKLQTILPLGKHNLNDPFTCSHCLHACMLSCFSCVQLFVTPWTVAHQAPLSMGFSRQES